MERVCLSSSLDPLNAYGIIIGSYFGYQKAVSEMPTQPGAIEQPR
jgi:hypothetical protein